MVSSAITFINLPEDPNSEMTIDKLFYNWENRWLRIHPGYVDFIAMEKFKSSWLIRNDREKQIQEVYINVKSFIFHNTLKVRLSFKNLKCEITCKETMDERFWLHLHVGLLEHLVG